MNNMGIGHGLKRVAEKANIKTDSDLKRSRIEQLSDEQLLEKDSSSRRAVVAALTGIGAGTVLVAFAGNPLGIGAAQFNSWQFLVASKNHLRARRECRRRRQEMPGFAALAAAHVNQAKDVGVAAGRKLLFTFLSMGLDGVAEMVDHAEVFQAALDGDRATELQTLPQQGLGLDQDGSLAERLEIKHPHVVQIDEWLQTGISGLSEEAVAEIAASTGVPISGETTLMDLRKMVENGTTDPDTAMRVADAAGLTGEAAQLPIMIAEWAWDKKDGKKLKQKAAATKKRWEIEGKREESARADL